MSTLKDRDEFMVGLAKAMDSHPGWMVVLTAKRLIRAASKHQRACEGDCSLRPPEGQPDYWTDMAAKAEADARKALDGMTCLSLEFQSDPRGCTMKLITKDGKVLFPPARGFPARVFA